MGAWGSVGGDGRDLHLCQVIMNDIVKVVLTKTMSLCLAHQGDDRPQEEETGCPELAWKRACSTNKFLGLFVF